MIVSNTYTNIEKIIVSGKRTVKSYKIYELKDTNSNNGFRKSKQMQFFTEIQPYEEPLSTVVWKSFRETSSLLVTFSTLS